MHADFKNLLKDCRDYKRKAQRQMMDLLLPFLLSVCRRYERNQAASQDLVQEALILIFNHIEDCQNEEKPFMGWCKRIAINVCLDKFRKRRIPFEHLEDQAIGLGVAPEVFAQLGAEDILQILDLLPQNQHLVFNLHVIDGYSYSEIGEMLLIKESSARTIFMRARQNLQKIFHSQELTVS